MDTLVIIGAGIIGSAISYELSQRGFHNITVLDVDLEGTYSSSERNAGGVRHLWQNPVNQALSSQSIKLYEHWKEDIGFHQKGYLWLCTLEPHLIHNYTTSLPYTLLTYEDIKKKYPFLDKLPPETEALYGPKDGIINPNALKQKFRSLSQKNGVVFRDKERVVELKQEKDSICVRTHVYGTNHKEAMEYLLHPKKTHAMSQQHSHALNGSHGSMGPNASNGYKEYQASWVIVASGAWSPLLLEPLLSESPLLTNHMKVNQTIQPKKRMIAFFEAPIDMSPYGMIVDTSGVYFHAEGGQILSGKVLDEAPQFDFSYNQNFFEEHIWPVLYERSSFFERARFIRGWSGLYSYTADTTGILGPVDPNFFPRIIEAHSFTGRGVMQAYGVALCVADWIEHQKFIHIPEAKGLSRLRFFPSSSPTSSLLPETFHI